MDRVGACHPSRVDRLSQETKGRATRSIRVERRGGRDGGQRADKAKLARLLHQEGTQSTHQHPRCKLCPQLGRKWRRIRAVAQPAPRLLSARDAEQRQPPSRISVVCAETIECPTANLLHKRLVQYALERRRTDALVAMLIAPANALQQGLLDGSAEVRPTAAVSGPAFESLCDDANQGDFPRASVDKAAADDRSQLNQK